MKDLDRLSPTACEALKQIEDRIAKAADLIYSAEQRRTKAYQTLLDLCGRAIMVSGKEISKCVASFGEAGVTEDVALRLVKELRREAAA